VNAKHFPDSQYLCRLAAEAGKIITKNFQLGMAFEMKEDDTPVTKADIAVNKLVIQSLSKDFPHIQVISEEGSRYIPSAEYTVLCDPIDGTLPFTLGIPISAFCISVLKNGKPIKAVIYDPFLKRIWSATRGKGCYLRIGNTEPREVRVSRRDTIHRSNVCIIWWKNSPYHLDDVCKILQECGANWINPCSIAYFGGLTASGELDATIFPGQKAWETAAMDLIVTEAGGKATDIYGYEIHYGLGGSIKGHIISNGEIHDELVTLVRRCQ
jgi:histidinol-phosphatase